MSEQHGGAPETSFEELLSEATDDTSRGSQPSTRSVKRNPKARKALIIGGGLVVAAALAVAGTSIAQALAAGSNYRTAAVERASVAETVRANGTIASASRFDLAFQTDGTVKTVKVAVGDEVVAGQTLATLDEDELKEAVTEAQQAVSDAKQTLAEHQESQASDDSSSDSAASAGSDDASDDSSTAPASGSADEGGDAAQQEAGSDSTQSPSSSSNGNSNSSSSGEQGNQGSSEPDPAVTEAIAKVTAAQQAMLEKYQEVQGLITDTNEVIAEADSSCQVFLEAVLVDTSSGEGEGEGEGEGSDSEGSTSTDGLTLEAAQGALEDCQASITAVQSGQASISAGQEEVQDLAAALDAATADLATAVEASLKSSGSSGSTSGSTGSSTANSGTNASSGSSAAGSGSSAAGSTGASNSGSAPSSTSSQTGATGSASAAETTGAAGGVGGTSVTITAEQLLADQAAINLAEAELKIAEAQLEFSALTSPIAGTVAAVALAVGDAVTAASDTAVITVIGADGYVATTTVSLTDIDKLEVGQTVNAVVASSGVNYSGIVSSIGVLNVSTTSTPAFDVIVALDTGEEQLLNGGSARLNIETASVDDALTVPSSAVHHDGNTASVDVLRGTSSETVEVEIGAVGAERTEIVSGVEEGDNVILADLNADIASDDESTTSTGLSGLGASSESSTTGAPGGEMPGGTGFTPPSGGGFPGQ